MGVILPTPVWKTSRFWHPVIVIRTKITDYKFARTWFHFINVFWNIIRLDNLGRPPPIISSLKWLYFRWAKNDVIRTLPQTNEPYGRNLTVVQCGQNQRLSSMSLSTSSSSASRSTLFLSPSRQALWYAAGHPSQISFGWFDSSFYSNLWFQDFSSWVPYY